jgi:RNA polymerase sigma-70 factor (ECF subfamily)
LVRLLPAVYDELHQLARSRLRRERKDHTLQPTALVNELFLRFLQQRRVNWQDRNHFFGVAAKLMRRILVDHAKRILAAKRGGEEGGPQPLLIDLPASLPPRDVQALDESLAALARFDARKSEIVELKFFSGCTSDEIASLLGVSISTVERDWRLSKAWLTREMERTP